MRTRVAALAITLLASFVSAQSIGHRATLRAATGALTAGETTGSLLVESRIDMIVVLSVTTLTLPDGDDEVDFYFQTSYDNGTTWTDLENVHFATADDGNSPTKIVRLGPWGPLSAADKAADNTDGTLADNTKKTYPVGGLIRLKTSVTGATAPTYAYSAEVFLR